MSDIFISYKREDEILVKSLAGKLSELGWSIWWDHDIPAGRDYYSVIEEEIESSKCVIVLWSETSIHSRNVIDEAREALEKNTYLPVLIGKIKPPIGFRTVQGVVWNDNNEVDETEFSDLVKHITRLLGNPLKEMQPEKEKLQEKKLSAVDKNEESKNAEEKIQDSFDIEKFMDVFIPGLDRDNIYYYPNIKDIPAKKLDKILEFLKLKFIGGQIPKNITSDSLLFVQDDSIFGTNSFVVFTYDEILYKMPFWDFCRIPYEMVVNFELTRDYLKSVRVIKIGELFIPRGSESDIHIYLKILNNIKQYFLKNSPKFSSISAERSDNKGNFPDPSDVFKANVFLETGNNYIDSGQYEKAISEYDNAIRLDPDFANAYHNRGYGYFNLEQYDKSISDFTKAIELNPNYDSAYRFRGVIYFELSQYDNAIADYNKAIKLNPDFADAYDIRGNIYFNLKEYDKAIADYNKAIKLNPVYAAAYNDRGNVYYNLEQYDKAMADYDKAIKLNPNYVYAFHNRGRIYYRLEQYDKAIADFNKVIELNPNDAESYSGRGNTYIRLLNFENAERDLQKAVELQPDTVSYYLVLSELFIVLSKYKESLEYLNDVEEKLKEKYEKFLYTLLKCITIRLSKGNISDVEDKFNQLLKEDISVQWDFRDLERFLKDNKSIDPDARKYIEDKINFAKSKSV